MWGSLFGNYKKRVVWAFSPSSDLLRCGFSLSVWLVRNEENEVLDLEFFCCLGTMGNAYC